MNKTRVAVLGYGNVGRCAVESVLVEPDMELIGIIEVPEVVSKSCAYSERDPIVLQKTRIVADVSELASVDVAILSCPSRVVRDTAKAMLQRGIRTVDSFDMHHDIPALRKELDAVAKEHKTVSILSAGWDPGIDSVIRGWFQAMAPRGITYTNYGPGLSMGHSVAVRSIAGVQDAISITVPAGMGVHRRMVYVQLKPGAVFEKVEAAIKKDPYFVKDRTYVFQVDDVSLLMDTGHGVLLERNGVSGVTHNQSMRFQLKVNNPALTAQVMVSAARAAMKQQPGCYTMIELPVVDFLYGDVDSFVTRLV
ncbi:MAG: diaminopimelate dehydrogenase [Bacteroidetes bacterium]|jgi:diaminopimelate dehydrogenase|nr:diaminopimelate dehydrogenase [Bacteroidota bacterium]